MSVTFKIDTKDLERKLKQLEELKSNRVAANVIYKSIEKASDSFSAVLKQETPIGEYESKGWKKYTSRNHPRGTLRDSVKKGLRKRIKDRQTFAGAAYYEMTYAQYYANFVLHKHNTNAFNFGGGHNFISKAVQRSEARTVSIMQRTLEANLTSKLQKLLDK